MAIRTSLAGYSFTALRILQCISIGPILALTGVLTVEVSNVYGLRPPVTIALALALSAITFVYALTTLLLHVRGTHGHLAASILDAVAATAMIVVALRIGRPLTQLDCGVVGARNAHIGSLGGVLFSTPTSRTTWGEPVSYLLDLPRLRGEGHFGAVDSGTEGLQSVGGLPALGTTREEVKEQMNDYRQWVGRVEDQCKAMKIVWGFSMLLPFLFIVTAILALILWRMKYHTKTFCVDTVNSEGVYSTHHEDASWGVMSEVSLTETDPEGSIEYPQYYPVVGARRNRVSSDS